MSASTRSVRSGPRRRRREPAVAPDKLTPFKSILLARPRVTLEADAVVTLLQEVRLLVSSDRVTAVSDVTGTIDDPNLQSAYFTYVEERPVAWARTSDLRDRSHQVVIACRGKGEARGHVAFFCSDGAIRDKTSEKIQKGDGTLGSLTLISPAAMNAAYVRGQTVTLWMSGTHRRVATRADTKVLSGLDLQYALDPMEDQSFFFTAARCRVAARDLPQPIGASPRRSRLWVGPSQDWSDFSKGVRALLDLIADEDGEVANPLPILAEPVLDERALAEVRGAYDAALLPPELLDPSATGTDTIELRDRVGFVVLEPFQQRGAHHSLRIRRPDGPVLGTVDLTYEIKNGGRIGWTTGNERDDGVDGAGFRSVLSALKHHRGWLKVWYDSGHVLADEALYATRFRDRPFADYVWVDFPGITVTKEKPTPLASHTIGKQDSLFCWVKRHWTLPGSGNAPGRGWLACDDGAMEKADFLHLDLVRGVPTLSLIHVKGSGSDAADRQVSVSDYEVVTSQAVKNLRWVDHSTLAGGLAGTLKGRIGDKVWHHGKPSTAGAFIKAIAKVGANYDRYVVILQPRLTKAAEVKCRRATRQSGEHLRLLQLDALLLSARASVLALNANFVVVGDGGGR